MIAQSQSGTGKTAAFVLAMLSRVDPSLNYPQVSKRKMGSKTLSLFFSRHRRRHLKHSTPTELFVWRCPLDKTRAPKIAEMSIGTVPPAAVSSTEMVMDGRRNLFSFQSSVYLLVQVFQVFVARPFWLIPSGTESNVAIKASMFLL